LAEPAKKAIGWEVTSGRSKYEKIKNQTLIKKRRDARDKNSYYRPDEVPTQCFQMVHKGHVFFFAIFQNTFFHETDFFIGG
jgi:hypothetical protein